MAIIRYERGADGVVRESVSNDGGKSFTQTGANSSNKYSGSASKNPTGGAGSDYGKYNENQYNNQKSYLDNLSKTGTQYNNTDVGTWDTSGQKWTNVGGTQGANYAISSDNGTIIVTDDNGVQTRFLPTSADYNSFFNNMMNDIKAAGNSYTPHYTFGVDADLDGQQEYHDTKAYTWGNADLQYAMQQAAKENPGLSVEDYVKSFYDRIGQNNAAGDGTVTVPSVDAELDRLGLSDWNSQNAILTAGQTLLPGNEFVTIGPDKTGDEGTWGFYGGQQYLLDGDNADFVEYVNGKTGNLNNNLSYIFGDMANNPYAMQDPEFMNQYLQGQTQFNNAAYSSTGVTGTGGSYTGNANVDAVIDYIGSVNNYIGASGGNTVDIWPQIQEMLQGNLTAQQDFIAKQRAYAEQQAHQQASDAFVNKTLAGDAMAEQLSALGLGTSGAVQSAQMGVQGDYSNNLATIWSNLNTMLNSLSEQELQALTEYMNQSTNFYYQIQNDNQDRAYQNAQLYMQQLEMERAQQQQEWENAYKQQLLDLDRQKYTDSQAQYQDETDYAKKLDSADYYGQMFNAEKMSAADYQRVLRQLGLIS